MSTLLKNKLIAGLMINISKIGTNTTTDVVFTAGIITVGIKKLTVKTLSWF